MSKHYPLGTVAVATVRGVENVRVMWAVSGPGNFSSGWRSAEPVAGGVLHSDHEVTDIRPLVVLDLDDPTSAARHLRATGWNIDRRIADQIEEQTHPPRIPEPGLWGVVEAAAPGYSNRGDWVRHRDGWRLGSSTLVRRWDDLIDPVLVRNGVE